MWGFKTPRFFHNLSLKKRNNFLLREGSKSLFLKKKALTKSSVIQLK